MCSTEKREKKLEYTDTKEEKKNRIIYIYSHNWDIYMARNDYLTLWSL